jgi:hypothetical protein
MTIFEIPSQLEVLARIWNGTLSVIPSTTDVKL